MLVFLFLSVLCYLDCFIFMVFCYFFLFLIFNDYSWGGGFLFYDSLFYVVLSALCFMVLLLVFCLENNYFLLVMSQVLVLLSILFFFSSSFLLLYFIYELSLFPIVFMILGYGSQIEKVSSSYYLFFYAVLCSFPFIFLYFFSGILLDFVYFSVFISSEFSFILSLVFLVKFPIYFFHLWLPKAHVEAPTVASMILAGLLLKLGCVGFLRVFGSVNESVGFMWVTVSFFGMLVCSFMCMFQSDVKSLAAYSSVVHMSMYLLMIMSYSVLSKSAGILVLFSHGVTSVVMFYFIGEFYSMCSSRLMYYFFGFFSGSFFLLVMTLCLLSNSGVPPSISFFCEYSMVSSVFSSFKLGLTVICSYLLLSFYYNIYLISLSLMGGGFYLYNSYVYCLCLVFCFFMYNIFFVILIF